MANNYVSVVTPAGTAVYPHLNEPDVKFNPMGEYKVSLAIDEATAAPLINKIEEVMEEARKMIPKGKRAKEADAPYFDELDDQGEPTGRVVFKLKMKAKITTKDGRTIEMSPKFFDSQGTYLETVDDIWGGSVLKLSTDLIPFYVAAVGAGVSMRLKAVQIIELRSGGGGSSAEAYGFEATEGFVAEPTPTAQDEGFSDEEIDEEDF